MQANKASLERHHLFPRAYLQKQGADTRTINQVANYALVEWSDNIKIGDKSPAEYFHEFVDRAKPSAEELRQMYFWHALPENWENTPYLEFLEKRRRSIAKVIRAGFEKLSCHAQVSTVKAMTSARSK